MACVSGVGINSDNLRAGMSYNVLGDEMNAT